MRRFWSSALLLLTSLVPALALDQASTPPKFPLVWGRSAGSAYIRSIPTTSQIGTQNCAASLTDGFPPLTFVSASAGGCPPFGADFNGILKQLSQWSQWGQGGGPVYYDSAFAAAIGGYPKGAILQSSKVTGNRWLSTADNNATNPDNILLSANWIQDPSQVQTGTPVPSLSNVVPPGQVSANGGTIGSAVSGAALASDAATFLYVFVWNNCPTCPIFTSVGTPTTRGANPGADFDASKRLAVPNLNGLGLMGADSQAGSSSSFLAGVPVTSGNTTTPGSIIGENLHSLTAGENGTHAHANTLTDPGHTHANTLTDPGHVHAVPITDPGHTHANTLTDPGHVHSVTVTDPGHRHTSQITQAQFNISTAGVGPFLFGASIGGGASSTLINIATTGITASADAHVTGVTINNASQATGITASASAHVTGVTINNASQATGLSINNVNSGSGTGHNTVERSAIVYWNLKL